MRKISYPFRDRTSSKLEVNEGFYLLHIALEHQQGLVNRKETRRHQSLNKSLECGFDFADMQVNIEDEAERNETREWLYNALKRLTEKQRIVLIDYAVNGFSFRGIARKMGLNKDTVREHYQAAIKKMRKFLKNTPPKFISRGY